MSNRIFALLGIVAVAVVILAGSLILPSQHSQAAQPQAHDMSTMAVNAPVIDGSVHPELITDNAAYRLFLLSVVPSSKNSDNEKTRQHLVLSQQAGLNSVEELFTQQILTDFRAQYDSLVATYNAAAVKALNENGSVDTAALHKFLAARDQLVEHTRARLASGLSANTQSSLHKHVQSEKSRMRVVVE